MMNPFLFVNILWRSENLNLKFYLFLSFTNPTVFDFNRELNMLEGKWSTWGWCIGVSLLFIIYNLQSKSP